MTMDAMGMNMFFEGLEDFPMSSPSSGPHTQVLNVMTGAREPNCWVLTQPTRREGVVIHEISPFFLRDEKKTYSPET